eukprot:TRINITY_DN8231_c0_g1_i1.p1 TRINITY_DN8231_c0_g1~~TRINITY_DN8231_c0_g1_i1.p1  ORF type:complete len:369 (-),score=78.48 TRINITY_DN8231_c0_g1_i1:836-1942(-)
MWCSFDESDKLNKANDYLQYFPNHTVFTLKGTGRKISYSHCGDPSGRPLICFHDLMAVGDFSFYDSEFKKRKLRVITPTLPGWGLSDSEEERQLQNYPREVEQLADRVLGLGIKFDVMGIGFGGIHALACAAALPHRVKRMAVLSGYAPFDDPAFDPFADMPASTVFFNYKLPQYFPSLEKASAWALRNSLMKDSNGFVDKIIESTSFAEKAQLDALGEERKEEFKQYLAQGAVNSLRIDTLGLVDSARLLRTPWGFSISDIQCPSLIMGCTNDKTTPFTMQKHIYKKLIGLNSSSTKDFGYFLHHYDGKHKLLEYRDGGHMTAALLLHEIVDEFLKLPDREEIKIDNRLEDEVIIIPNFVSESFADH